MTNFFKTQWALSVLWLKTFLGWRGVPPVVAKAARVVASGEGELTDTDKQALADVLSGRHPPEEVVEVAGDGTAASAASTNVVASVDIDNKELGVVDPKHAMKERIRELMEKGLRAIEKRDKLELAILGTLLHGSPEAFDHLMDVLAELQRDRGEAHPRMPEFTDLHEQLRERPYAPLRTKTVD